jgi:polysaccharide biosynthesis protein PslH
MARVLALTSRLPFPPREGHQLRSWNLLRALATRHEVTLLSFAREDDDLDAVHAMRSAFAGVEVFPLPGGRAATGLLAARSLGARRPFVAARYASPTLRACIAALAPQADVVHVDMLPLMRHADLVPASTPVVYNAHNVEHALLAARAATLAPRRLRSTLERMFIAHQVPRLRAFEQAACRRADLVLACSDADAGTLRALAHGGQVAVVPNGVDLDGNRPAPPSAAGTAPALVFVGQMGWFPNRDGVHWFLREVLPRILAARPDVRFVVVGKADGLEVPEAVAASVTVTGFVPDLRPLVHDAAVYVVPLRAGSGTRLKVLEAMALGKAIVTTTVGSEGIDLPAGDAALYADDAAGFAGSVLALLEDDALRARLGTAARQAAEQRYGWDAIGRDLLGHYERLLAARVAAGASTPSGMRSSRSLYQASPTSS